MPRLTELLILSDWLSYTAR